MARKKGETKSEVNILGKFKELSPAVFWIALTFIVTFGVFFISLVPTQIRLKEGEVSPLDVKAPQEVVDDYATDLLRAEKAQGVKEVFEIEPGVLEVFRGYSFQLSKALDSPDSATMTQEQMINSIKNFTEQDLSNEELLQVFNSADEVLDGLSLVDEIVSEILIAGLRTENLGTAKENAVASLLSRSEYSPTVVKYLASFIRRNMNPNMYFNQEETEKRIQQAMNSVEPVIIRRGQFIVREGDIVTENHIRLLEKLGMMGARVRVPALSGAALMSVIVCGFIAVYLFTFHPEIIKNNKKVALVSVTVVLSMLMIKGFTEISGYLAPVATGVMLASTTIDRRFGLFFAACLAVSTGVMTGFEIRYVVLALVGGIVAALSIRRVWNRYEIFRAGLIVAFVMIITCLGLGLTGVIVIDDVLSWKNSTFVLLNGPLAGVLAVGSLPLFETVFGIITPLKLMEISNPEHPLLHRLMMEAPGTYHHSIMTGNLAETAAWAIGTDSLLTRVGAYYHDVGKIKKPYFFAENQLFGVENPHDKMNPNLSSSVIISHVKDGLELAKEHKLPEVIQKFIAEHHGTTLASYFYLKASENPPANGRAPEEWDFRYEGPRPSSKETALVMLADSVEAATRSLSKPTPERIESIVRKIIDERLTDHQLDKCDLTLRELDIIAETFTKVLTGIFHTRVEYPDAPEGRVAKSGGKQDGS